MLRGEAGHACDRCGVARKVAGAAQTIRMIRGMLSANSGDGLRVVLDMLEREMSEIAALDRRGEEGQSCGLCSSVETEAMTGEIAELAFKTRGMARILVHFFASHVQADMRASTYSRQQRLDDVELMLEMLLELQESQCERVRS
ncbi:MAG: hypothetical protein OEZ32_13335 [Nitrospinota bacterium]|nr:hypothetical protein [Nitrospinota bacterium]